MSNNVFVGMGVRFYYGSNSGDVEYALVTSLGKKRRVDLIFVSHYPWGDGTSIMGPEIQSCLNVPYIKDAALDSGPFWYHHGEYTDEEISG